MKFYILCTLCYCGSVFATAPVLLTGEVSSSRTQVITVPRSNAWQVHIQWMAEEGAIVQQGDVVAVFDGASVAEQLESNQETLVARKLEQKKLLLEQQLQRETAKAEYQQSVLQVQKARIEAALPEGKISGYDKERYQLALEQALFKQAQAKAKLTLVKQESTIATKKKKLEIQRLMEDIQYQEKLLHKMSVKAKISGPVTYATNPRTGKKFSAGMNAQSSFRIMEIQAMDEFVVRSWVHEIDVGKLQQGQTLTMSLDAYPKQTFSGTLHKLVSQSEKKSSWSNSAYYPIEVTFSPPEGVKLLPGMSVRLSSEAAFGETQ